MDIVRGMKEGIVLAVWIELSNSVMTSGMVVTLDISSELVLLQVIDSVL